MSLTIATRVGSSEVKGPSVSPARLGGRAPDSGVSAWPRWPVDYVEHGLGEQRFQPGWPANSKSLFYLSDRERALATRHGCWEDRSY